MPSDMFEDGFHNMMSSALEYEGLRKQGKPIPEDLQRRLDEARDWVSNLSNNDYSRLIH